MTIINFLILFALGVILFCFSYFMYELHKKDNKNYTVEETFPGVIAMLTFVLGMVSFILSIVLIFNYKF